MPKIPYIPIYIGDWEQDLNSCMIITEGAWMKIIVKMFKDNKSGIYKTTTKSLQILWKSDEGTVREIIEDLLLNDICIIKFDGNKVKFTNRRMLEDKEISGKRSKAVQTRYKTSTNDVQITEDESEIDNEVENEIKYPFETQTFLSSWDLWKAHRKEADRFTYKPIGEQSALMELNNLSGMNEVTAIKIINQSIAKSWKGFFELKNNTNESEQEKNRRILKELADDRNTDIQK